MDSLRLPKVSVIVATYHREEPLKRTLESIAAQTYEHLEVIVVDDNADTEWNRKVVSLITSLKEEYHNFPLFYICNLENKGSAESRNIGIKSAHGEYITFLDDDDVYLPEKVEKQVHDMERIGADYGLTDLNLYDKNNKLVDRRIRSYIRETDQKSLLRYHLMYHMTGTDTLMFKKNYLEEIGMFPPINVGDEFFLMERAITHGGKLCYSPECYVKAYVHEGTEEGLSSGEQKIIGENSLYEEKKQHFAELARADIRFIKVRHHLVIAFAQMRRKYWASMIKHSLIAMLISPFDVYKVIKQR